ncbi:GAF domain-containing protein [Candidatus Parcubacteria bacterium]|nr:MAG: GAF domain-containing protein [Candidatus Parcubacteria bacterium]
MLQHTEDHLKRIQKILRGEQGLFWRLKKVALYLLETHDLACVGIFRCVGDELDDYVYITGNQEGEDVGRFAALSDTLPGAARSQVKVIASRFIKQKNPVHAPHRVSELVVPIQNFQQIVGALHVERTDGRGISPAERQLFEQAARLIGRHFIPTVIHVG